MESPKKNQKRVAIYTRVSTAEQVDGHSLGAQLDKCQGLIQYQRDQDWVFCEHYMDGGHSGGTKDRPALKHMMSAVRAGLIDVILVYKLDRLSRSVSHFYDLWDELQSSKVELVSATQEINTTTSTGKMFMSLLMTFAEFERNVIMERSQMGVDEKIKNSDFVPYMGNPDAYGYKYDHNTKNQIIEKSEVPTVKKIFDLFFIHRKNYAQISQNLLAEGVKTRIRLKKNDKSKSRGGVNFTPQSVRNMIGNPIYAGKRRYNNRGDILYDKGEQEAILDTEMIKHWELWYSINRAEVLADESSQMGKKAPAKILKPSMNKNKALFKGILFHAETGEALTPSASGKKNKKTGESYLYYEPANGRKIPGQEFPRFSGPKIEQIALGAFEILANEAAMLDRILGLNKIKHQGRVTELTNQLKVISIEIKKSKDDVQRMSKMINPARKTISDQMSVELDKENLKQTKLIEREGVVRNLLVKIQDESLSLESLKKMVKNISSLTRAMSASDLSVMCQAIFKRIEVRFLDPSEVQSESGGYAHRNGRIVFPMQSPIENKVKNQPEQYPLRTKWVQMKITLQANVENDLVFTDDAIVRIRERLAFPTRFELVYPP